MKFWNLTTTLSLKCDSLNCVLQNQLYLKSIVIQWIFSSNFFFSAANWSLLKIIYTITCYASDWTHVFILCHSNVSKSLAYGTTIKSNLAGIQFMSISFGYPCVCHPCHSCITLFVVFVVFMGRVVIVLNVYPLPSTDCYRFLSFLQSSKFMSPRYKNALVRHHIGFLWLIMFCRIPLTLTVSIQPPHFWWLI